MVVTSSMSCHWIKAGKVSFAWYFKLLHFSRFSSWQSKFYELVSCKSLNLDDVFFGSRGSKNMALANPCVFHYRCEAWRECQWLVLQSGAWTDMDWSWKCVDTLPDWRDPVKKMRMLGLGWHSCVSGWCWIFPNAKKIWRLPIHINPCGVALNIPQSSIAWGMFHENHPAIGIGDPPLMEPPIDCAALTGGGAGIFLREAVAGWSWRMSMVKKNREKNQLNIPSGNLT